MMKPPFSAAERQEIFHTVQEKNGVLVFPTETFYGIGGSACADPAVEKIYRLKKRKKTLPLLILISNWEMLKTYFQPVCDDGMKLLQAYWPGALTAILHPRNNLSGVLNAAGQTIAVRMSSCPLTRELVDICQVPLVGTSANLSGQKESTRATDVIPVFGDDVDLYIDGGQTPGGQPSTIIDLTTPGNFKVIRQGVLEVEIPK